MANVKSYIKYQEFSSAFYDEIMKNQGNKSFNPEEWMKSNMDKYLKTNSEVLKEKANAEENDLAAMGIYKKSMREKRFENFQEYFLELEKQGYDILYDEPHVKYTIDTNAQEEKHGIIDYYPKSNKLLIRKKNKWINPGLPWIIKNLLTVNNLNK